MASDKKVKKRVDKGQTGDWKFDESVLGCSQLRIDYPNHYLPIKHIIKHEKYKSKNSFEKQQALFLDKIEIERAKLEGRNQRSTTDFAIGIVRKKSGSNKRIRLVECKFDVTKDNRKIIEDLRDKNKKTRDYFRFEHPIQPLFIVLLNDKYYQQGRRFIMNSFSNALDCEVMSVNDFYSQYFHS